MSAVITFKFIIEEDGKPTGDIRRVTLKAPTSLQTLRAAAEDILGWNDVVFHFKDEDGDVVTIASQHELDTAISFAANGPVRLNVCHNDGRAVEEAPAAVPSVAEVAHKQPEAPADAAAEVVPDPAPEVAAAPAPAPVPAAAAPAPAPVPAGNGLETAPDATIPENVMVQFSAIAEFFQRMAQQMAEFAPRIPVIVNEGIRKMSTSAQNNFNPLEVSVTAARNAPAAADPELPEGAYNVVVHRLPESVVHPGIECAHCHKKPLTGMRYKCVQCDCDLCQDCVFIPGVHDEGHRFLPVCAPAVGSHFMNSAAEACESVKNRAAPVVNSVVSAAAPVVESVILLLLLLWCR